MFRKLTIYIFGNPLLSFDNLPLRILPKLKKKFPQINFRTLDPNENIKPKDGKLFLIDTVIGIPEVTIINDLNCLKTDNRYTLHDLDLAFHLKLLHKIGQLKKVTIFGVPPEMSEPEALAQLTKLIREYFD